MTIEPSQQQLAAALGVDPALVTRYKRRGMPVDSVDAAQAWRRANVRPRMTPRPAAAPPSQGAADDDGERADYLSSRARREAAEAELTELKLAEQRGELVRAADVRAALSRRIAATRESLLQLPARLAPVLAAEADQARCQGLLQDELHAVLAALTAT